jgi:hypothetical protein
VDIARAATGATLYFARAYQILVGMTSVEPTDFRVYPNPARDQLYLMSTSEVPSEFYLYDLRGAKVFQQRIQPGESIINVADLQPALYYFIISSNNEGQQMSGKLIIQ